MHEGRGDAEHDGASAPILPTVIGSADSPPDDGDDWTFEPGENWTKGPDGRSNSSEHYHETVDKVARIIRADAHTLIGGGAQATASLIVAQLAHRYGFGPVPGTWTRPLRDGEDDRTFADRIEVIAGGDGVSYTIDPPKIEMLNDRLLEEALSKYDSGMPTVDALGNSAFGGPPLEVHFEHDIMPREDTAEQLSFWRVSGNAFQACITSHHHAYFGFGPNRRSAYTAALATHHAARAQRAIDVIERVAGHNEALRRQIGALTRNLDTASRDRLEIHASYLQALDTIEALSAELNRGPFYHLRRWIRRHLRRNG